MHLMYFTEQPMSAYDESTVGDDGITALLYSNKHFDAAAGSRLYQERLEQYQLAEAVGYDGIMLNEHHNAPFCMQPQIQIWAAALAMATERVKIVLLGSPLPVSDNPVAIAEGLAVIDMMSKGRLVAGMVRGAGTEMYANNSNPAYNRERFNEAHDLVIKTWTEPGPWRWEGNHYQQRVVNPWATPFQKPHPRIWVPGVSSPETIVWAAEHRYPYIALNTTMEATEQIWSLYERTAQNVGYTSGPEHRGYLLRCFVADTKEQAEEGGRQFMWMQGEFIGLGHPVWYAPTGYSTAGDRAATVKRVAAGAEAKGGPDRKRRAPSYESQLDSRQIIAGTPDQVIEQLRWIMERARPGIFALWGNDGRVNHEDSKRCIELMGKEVLPALREIAKELELPGPFEGDVALSLQFPEPPRVAVEA